MCIWYVLTLGQHYIHIPHWTPTAYNHIVTLVGAACVLMLFLTWKFQNKVVNWLALGSLSIYLLHANIHIWPLIKNALIGIFDRYGMCPTMKIGCLVVFAIVLSVCVACADHLRLFIQTIIFEHIKFNDLCIDNQTASQDNNILKDGGKS